MNVAWLFASHNLIFLLPLLLALLYVGVYAISGVTFGDPDVGHGDFDADADAHIDADGNIETDVDADAHIDADADVHADADAHGDVHADADSDSHHPAVEPGSVLANFLSMLGLGKVPLSILLMVLFLAWGVFGLGANMFLMEKVADPRIVMAISLPVAFIASLACCRLLTAAMVRWFPMIETSAQRRHELLGAVGEAILPIDSNYGMVSVRDIYHDLFHVPCRVHSDQPPLDKGTKVKLIAYNGKQKVYYVKQHDEAAVSRTA
jgi:membrane protein implicated in regulation of membrane protease activity